MMEMTEETVEMYEKHVVECRKNNWMLADVSPTTLAIFLAEIRRLRAEVAQLKAPRAEFIGLKATKGTPVCRAGGCSEAVE